jgi:hypothetical protein
MLGRRRGQFRQSALAVCDVRSLATTAGLPDPRVQTSSADRRQSLREHDPAGSLDGGKVGERLREVAEVVSGVDVELLGVQSKRGGDSHQLFIRSRERCVSPMIASAETSQKEQIRNVPSSPRRGPITSASRREDLPALRGGYVAGVAIARRARRPTASSRPTASERFWTPSLR